MSNESETLDNSVTGSATIFKNESIADGTNLENSIPDIKPINSDTAEFGEELAVDVSNVSLISKEVMATKVTDEDEDESSRIELTKPAITETAAEVAVSSVSVNESISCIPEAIIQTNDESPINEDEKTISNQTETVEKIHEPICTETDDRGSKDDDQIVAAESCKEKVEAESSIELPSIGILVEDDNAGTSNQAASGNSSTKDNSSMRKVSAKLSLESLLADVPKASNVGLPLQSCPEIGNSRDGYDQDTATLEVKGSIPTAELEEVSDLPLEGAVAVEPDLKKSESLSPTCAALKQSPSDIEHKVKRIKFLGKEVPIITQNNNGPCPLLAILNALLLRGEVELGVSGPVVKGGHLVGVVANALIDLSPPGSAAPQLLHNVQRNTDDAVQILDKLLTGLDVNVKFSGVQDFEFTNELCVFDGVRVNLYHGWVVDPEWASADVVRDLSYNQLTNNILIWRHEAGDQADNWLLMKAVLCEEFLHCSSSQLTVHGLFVLGSTMQDGEVAVLFRNNHFSTIYKHKDHLYQLLTDQGFLTEAATWQTLSDVDASFSEFVTETFEPWQQKQSVTAPSSPPPNFTVQQQLNTDEELAAMLQKESDQMCRNEEDFSQMIQQFEWNDGLSDEELARRLQEEEVRAAEAAAAASQTREGGATAQQQNRSEASGTSRQSSPPPPPASPRDQAKKKKDQCCIL